ncbi:MAG TPA: ABC transporter ATP-binding protein, partial [Mycobacteriales bacterium]
MSAPGWRLFLAGLRGHGRPLRRVLVWSVVEALPTLVSGTVVAHALDEGFLVGRPGPGLVWLGLLAGVLLVSAVATRALYPHLGTLVEGLRDHLVRSLTGATLRHAVDDQRHPDRAVVARLTEQVESVRRLSGALFRTLRQLTVAVVASVVGVTALDPVLGLLVAPPLVCAVGLFGWLLARLRVRQRDLVLAGEVVAARTSTVLGGLRDVVACRARHRAA